MASTSSAVGLTLVALCATACAAGRTAPLGSPGTAVPATTSPVTAAAPATTAGRGSSPVPRRPRAGTFSLTIRTSRGDITTTVAPMSVASHQPVDPPHETARQWNTAVWIVQAAYPATPSRGTTYVYGHACHHHTCPFTRLGRAAVGNTVIVTTPWQVLTYRVDRIGLTPKAAAALPAWASDSTTADRIVLVTCRYEHGDVSTHDLVVTANLVSG